jgi:LETM1 and EF-hand domain-containing protein 1
MSEKPIIRVCAKSFPLFTNLQLQKMSFYFFRASSITKLNKVQSSFILIIDSSFRLCTSEGQNRHAMIRLFALRRSIGSHHSISPAAFYYSSLRFSSQSPHSQQNTTSSNSTPPNANQAAESKDPSRLASVEERLRVQAASLKLNEPSLPSRISALPGSLSHFPNKFTAFVESLPKLLVHWTRVAFSATFSYVQSVMANPQRLMESLRSLKKATAEVAHHYWTGSKLLYSDVRTASRITRQVLQGQSLTRRERKALLTTAADLFRLVPFAIIVIVPFMELLLPVLLKLFPNMLPSTFSEPFAAEEGRKKQLKARIELARFLQDTVEEMALKRDYAHELGEFIARVRSGGPVSNDEILKLSAFFQEEMTLDSMSRPQLVALCRYMGIGSLGSDGVLRFQLRNSLRQLKADDRMIYWEGVNSLSLEELKQACAARGMRSVDISKNDMRNELTQWLELSLNQNVPATLLIISRAFTLLGSPSTADGSTAAASASLTDSSSSTSSSASSSSTVSSASSTAANASASTAAAAAAAAREHEVEVTREEEQEERIVEAVQVLASSSPVLMEKQALEEIKEDVAETVVEEKQGKKLKQRVENMLQRLEGDIQEAERLIGSNLNVIDRDRDGVISREEVEQVLTLMKTKPDADMVQRLMERLDPDHDGVVLLHEVERVLGHEDKDKAAEKKKDL